MMSALVSGMLARTVSDTPFSRQLYQARVSMRSSVSSESSAASMWRTASACADRPSVASANMVVAVGMGLEPFQSVELLAVDLVDGVAADGRANR